MAERGRIVLMAGREARPEFPVGPFYVKGCSLHGFVMFKATPAEMSASAEDINRWLSSGGLPSQYRAAFHSESRRRGASVAGRKYPSPDGDADGKNRADPLSPPLVFEVAIFGAWEQK